MTHMVTRGTQTSVAAAVALALGLGCSAPAETESATRVQSDALALGQASSIEFKITGNPTTYAGQSRDDLVAFIDASPLLCGAMLDSTERYGGGQVPTGPCSFVGVTIPQGYYLGVGFRLSTEVTFDVRLGPDYGLGGALFVDGGLLADATRDLWWNLDWDYAIANGQALTADGVTLGAGTHVIETIGFEGCCAGPQSLQHRSGGGEWLPFVFVPDSDGDGVPDAADACPGSAAGAVVNDAGCSIAQVVPCAGAWRNHGAYVSTLARTAEDFVDAGLITEAEKDAIVAEGARSTCGK